MTLKQLCTILACWLLAPGILCCQDTLPLNQDLLNYAAAHPPTEAVSLEEIAATLQLKATTEKEKAEIVFYWIAEHIDYETADVEDKGSVLDLNQVIQRRKGNVQTFSQLYRELCVLMGLTCHIVPGYVRFQVARFMEYYDYTGRLFNLPDRPVHTWNAVKIDGQYYFVDVSMGSSILGGDSEEVIFIKKYDLSYVLVNEFPFIATHLPADPRWQMRDYPISLRMYYSDLFYDDMVEKSKASPLFDYQTAIASYETADDANQRLMRLKSTYEFYPAPFNARQLADAYYNMAYTVAQQPYATPTMIDARRYYQQAIDVYKELEQDATVKQLLSQARQGITYVNYRLEHKQ